MFFCCHICICSSS